MKKTLILITIVLLVALVFVPNFASARGPKCNNPGAAHGVCSVLTNCRDAALDTNDILGSSAPIRVCLFGGGSAP